MLYSIHLYEKYPFFIVDATDVLSFIRESNEIPVWRKSALSNRINQEPRVLAAPTYLLFDNEFPPNSVLHISFKGPVTDSQFLFSVYSVNEKMEFGIMLKPFSLEFNYNKRIDAAVNIPITRRFPYTFTENKWYNLAILLKNEEVQVKLDCEETVASALEEKLFKEFDIYGKMYLGADESKGKERIVKVCLYYLLFIVFSIPENIIEEQINPQKYRSLLTPVTIFSTFRLKLGKSHLSKIQTVFINSVEESTWYVFLLLKSFIFYK